MKQFLGNVILVDNESFELDLMQRAIDKLNLNTVLKCFTSAEDAIYFIKNCKEKIFIIFSDLDMPQMDGIEFKKIVNHDPVLREKAIPFVFLSSNITKEGVEKAYEHGIQGYFYKPTGIDELINIVRTIVDYWSKCKHPNNYFE
jgi:CheY-like chemotaxis protein